MGVGHIEHGAHVLALPAGIAEAGDRFRRIALQPRGKIGIDPGLGHHAGTVARADLRFIGLDDRVDRRRIDQPLLGQHRFQRLHPRFHVGEMVVMVMMVVIVTMMVFGHCLAPRNGAPLGRRRRCLLTRATVVADEIRIRNRIHQRPATRIVTVTSPVPCEPAALKNALLCRIHQRARLKPARAPFSTYVAVT
ncbi:hypothetical protein D9M72_439310 [compost metagenome]